MTELTAIELAGNYPDNIQIDALKSDNGKFAAFCYRLKDGEIHKLMLSTQPVFENEEEANNSLHEVAKACVKHFS